MRLVYELNIEHLIALVRLGLVYYINNHLNLKLTIISHQSHTSAHFGFCGGCLSRFLDSGRSIHRMRRRTWSWQMFSVSAASAQYTQLSISRSRCLSRCSQLVPMFRREVSVLRKLLNNGTLTLRYPSGHCYCRANKLGYTTHLRTLSHNRLLRCAVAVQQCPGRPR